MNIFRKRNWTAITLVLLAALWLTACGSAPETGAPQTASEMDAPPLRTDAETETAEATAPTVEEPGRTVIYYSDDDTVVKIEQVGEDEQMALPSSPELSYGNVFEKWDAPEETGEDMQEVRPIYKSTLGIANVFAMPGTYGTSGDEITVPLRLCGEVELCGFDLTVEYDPDKLQLERVYDEDEAVILNAETPGCLRINYVSVSNTIADVDICCLKFRVLADQGEVPITQNMVSIYSWNGNGDLAVPDYHLMDGCVYIQG